MRILSILYTAWAAMWVLIGFVVTMPVNLVLMRFTKAYSIIHFIRKIWAYFIFLPSAMYVKVQGKEELIGLDKFIYAPNHSSYIDIPACTLALPGTLCFMAKAELARIPVFGYFFKSIDIAVNRGSIISAHNGFKTAGERLDIGQIPLIFPEGTIPANSPELGRFKSGAFKLAITKNVPIVPVTMLDNSKRFPDNKPLRATPGKMRVIIHRPIPTSHLNIADSDALMQEVYDIIEASLKKHHAI